MYSVIYIASGAGPHPTVLMLHGFPGNEKNLDLAHSVNALISRSSRLAGQKIGEHSGRCFLSMTAVEILA
jgi:hypothetical protein